MKDNKINKFIFWLPRILGIILVLFLALMSFDVITEYPSTKEIVLGLFMHNIPTFICLFILIISWKYEMVGGIAFNAAGLFYIGLLLYNDISLLNILTWGLQISGVAFLIGIFFLINYFKKKRNSLVTIGKKVK